MLKKIKFDSKEVSALALTVLVLSFILSFSKWGAAEFDLFAGLKNLLITAVVVAISLIIKITVQKYASAKSGFDARFKPWMVGLILGIICIFLSNGKFYFLAAGSVVFALIETARIGAQDKGLSYGRIAWISALGPITSIILALIVRILSNSFLNEILLNAVTINLLIAVYSILPLPFIEGFNLTTLKKTGSSDGFNLMYHYPIEYIVVALMTLGTGAAIWLMPLKYALYSVIAYILLFYFVYMLFYRQNLPQDKPGQAI